MLCCAAGRSEVLHTSVVVEWRLLVYCIIEYIGWKVGVVLVGLTCMQVTYTLG